MGWFTMVPWANRKEHETVLLKLHGRNLIGTKLRVVPNRDLDESCGPKPEVTRIHDVRVTDRGLDVQLGKLSWFGGYAFYVMALGLAVSSYITIRTGSSWLALIPTGTAILLWLSCIAGSRLMFFRQVIKNKRKLGLALRCPG